jgi:hypothetical protein
MTLNGGKISMEKQKDLGGGNIDIALKRWIFFCTTVVGT